MLKYPPATSAPIALLAPSPEGGALPKPIASASRLPAAAIAHLVRRVRGWDRWFKGLVLGMVVYFAAYSVIATLKYLTFNTYAWDLGIYNQVMWSLVHGNGFQYTVEFYINPSGNYLAQHFAPDLILLTPFYALVPSPVTLLVIQSGVVAVGAWPVAALARLRGIGPRPALFLSLSYLLFPAVWGANWYDFHLETFFMVAMLFAVLFWFRRRWIWFWAAVLVGLGTVESTAFLVAFFGLTLILVSAKPVVSFLRRPRLRPAAAWMPLLVLGASILYFVVVRAYQHFLNPVIPPAFETVYRASDNWSVLGIPDPLNPLALLEVLVLHPDRMIAALAYAALAKALYLVFFLLPLLFLPLRKAWWLLPAVPWFVGLLLSNYSPYYFLGYQYSAFLVPWFYVAAILAFDPRPRDLRPRRSPYPFRDFPSRVTPEAVVFAGPTYFVLFVLVLTTAPALQAALGTQADFGPGLASGTFLPNAHTSAVWALVNLVPSSASVVTQSNLFPPLSSRESAYVIPYLPQLNQSWDLVVPHISGPIQYVLLDPASDPPASTFMLLTFVSQGGYGLRAQAGTAELYEWGYQGAVQHVGS